MVSGVGVLFGISIVCQLFMMMYFFDWLAWWQVFLVVGLVGCFFAWLDFCLVEFFVLPVFLVF